MATGQQQLDELKKQLSALTAHVTALETLGKDLDARLTKLETAPPPSALNPAGYMTLVFSDDFSNGLDAAKWVKGNWNVPAGSVECKDPNPLALDICLKDNVFVSDGQLHIVTKRQPYTATELQLAGKTFEFTSGILSTAWRQYFTPPFYAEARVLQPQGVGLWSMFYFVRKYEDVPGGPYQEADVFEYLGKDVSKYYATFHIPDSGSLGVPFSSEDWHTYAVDVRLDGCTWYLDGEIVREWAATILPVPMYLILNTTTGGWGGAVGAEFQESEMVVDAVRLWTP